LIAATLRRHQIKATFFWRTKKRCVTIILSIHRGHHIGKRWQMKAMRLERTLSITFNDR
jgi:peptidoglycan/xylan/chitin deacetylase (PgdA/CDA1 family)